MNPSQSILFALQGSILGVSLWLWVRAIRSWKRGKSFAIDVSPSSAEETSTIDLTGFLIGFLALPVLVLQFMGNDPQQVMVSYQVKSIIFLLFVMVWSLIRRAYSGRAFEKEQPSGRSKRTLRAILLGGWGFSFSFLPVSLLLFVVSPFRSRHPLLENFLNNPSPEMWRTVIVTAVCVAPIFEEFLFRVLLQSALKNLVDASSSILFSSMIFSISHGWTDAIPLFPLAVTLGYLYHKTGSYGAIVVTHGLFNAYNLLVFRLSGMSN